MSKLRGAIAVAVSTLCIAGFTVPAAHADPGAVDRARAELEKIQQESSAIDQDIIEASARAGDSMVRLDEITADLEEQEAKVSTMASDLGEIAVVQLQSGGFDVTAQLLASNSESSFLSSLATIQNEADRSNSNLQLLQVEQAEVDALRADADRTNAALQAELEAKEELAQRYDAKEAEARAIFDRLSEQEQERLRQLELQRQREQEEADRLARAAAEQAASEQAAAEQGAAEPASPDSPSSDAGTDPAPAPAKEAPATSAGGSSRAQSAIAAATSKVGSRYVWGTSGPGTFDCSGLTSYAYRQVGVSLPRSSRAQFGMGTKVAKSDLQPGDLVFYYSPVSHVGIYIGNGKIVDAANPRSGVRITSLNSMPYSGARRVG